MLHPLATLLFDLFLIGTAGLVVVAMVQEYLVHREPCVGSSRRAPAARRAVVRSERPVRKALPQYAARRATSRRFAA